MFWYLPAWMRRIYTHRIRYYWRKWTWKEEDYEL